MKKKIFCLGGAGSIAREAVYDLFENEPEFHIRIADINSEAARVFAESFESERVDWIHTDLTQIEATVEQMKGFDVVLDGTQITMNGISTECIAKAGCSGINLNGFGAEKEWNDWFVQQSKTLIAGFGMTPGLTQLMCMDSAQHFAIIDDVYVSHGSFRPIAFSRAIAETTRYEYDPSLPTRVVYHNGEFVQVPPFALPKDIQLPEPYGMTTQYIIPHSETITLAKHLAAKGVQNIETRGTWPKENMKLLAALYDWGILNNEAINVNDKEIGIMDCIGEYLVQCEKGKKTALYGYALHVECTGTLHDGTKATSIHTHTHPASDGSVKEWAGLRAYTKNVGIPFGIACAALAKGEVKQVGVIDPEQVFLQPHVFFEALGRRGIVVHHTLKHNE
ncbi:MAG: saccharopine dehydrogenase family protein [Bacilli bacterium]